MLTRRGFMAGSLSAIGAACARGPAIHGSAPAVTHGVQAGDVGLAAAGGRALIWARASEPARMIVGWDTSERFKSPRRLAGPVVSPGTDLAATLAISGLPAGETIAYRVRFGTVDIEPGAATVTLWGIDGQPRYRVELPYRA